MNGIDACALPVRFHSHSDLASILTALSFCCTPRRYRERTTAVEFIKRSVWLPEPLSRGPSLHHYSGETLKGKGTRVSFIVTEIFTHHIETNPCQGKLNCCRLYIFIKRQIWFFLALITVEILLLFPHTFYRTILSNQLLFYYRATIDVTLNQ